MTSAQPCSTEPTNGIDFVDKDNARRMFFPLLEEIANTGCSDTDKHFYEIRSADTKERHTGFTGNGLGQQRFSCPGRTDNQDALGNAAAELLKLARILEKLDDLEHFVLGFIDTRNVGEQYLLTLLRQHTSAALPE